LTGSTNKKVIVRRFDREAVAGFISPQSYLQPEGVEIMSLAGAVLHFPYREVKTVCFVRDFLPDDPAHERKAFGTRPKKEGLWVRLRFRDAESMEGLMANNLVQTELAGYVVTPPDPYSNVQRMFVPRLAMEELVVLGVVQGPLRSRKAPAVPLEQLEMFGDSDA
jgi:hypothetical protein